MAMVPAATRCIGNTVKRRTTHARATAARPWNGNAAITATVGAQFAPAFGTYGVPSSRRHGSHKHSASTSRLNAPPKIRE